MKLTKILEVIGVFFKFLLIKLQDIAVMTSIAKQCPDGPEPINSNFVMYHNIRLADSSCATEL